MFALYQPHQITYQQRKITIWYIQGLPQSITVDRQGRLYFTWWQPQGVSGNLAERRDRKWRIQERHHRRFPDIFALFRGLTEIMGKADQLIPTLETVRQECLEIHIKMTNLRQMKPTQIRQLKQGIDQAQQSLQRAQKPELQEATQQLEFCILLRDKTGRINVGALQARLVAVNNRFIERLTGIYAWLTNYAAWRQALKHFTQTQEKALKWFKQSLGAALQHKIFTEEIAKGQQKPGLIARLKQLISWLENLTKIKGFDSWAKHCLSDLNQAIQFIQKDEFAQAKQVIIKLKESVRLKQIQFRVNNLLLQIKMDIIYGQPDWDSYQQTIDQIIEQLKAIDETGFQQPVCRKIQQQLETAQIYLIQFSSGSRPIREAQEALRQALILF